VISCDFVVAVCVDCEVYAWGNNAMGQCGLGHSQGPVTSPKLVTALCGAHVQQVSAGTSHSLAWTAIHSDRCIVDCFCFHIVSKCACLLRYCSWVSV